MRLFQEIRRGARDDVVGPVVRAGLERCKLRERA